METIIYRDRRDTNSYKWDHLGKKFSRDGLLPLWVADMDFAAPQCVREALKDRAEFGVFGYELAPVDCDAAFLQWERSRHGYDVKPEWVRHSPSVVAGLNWLIQVVTEPGDGVLIQTPVYYPFMSAVTDHGRRLVKNELVNTHGVYTIDFTDFERKITEERVRAFILCSPHNPVGRVWTRAELEEMLTICRRHGVTVISDEIHQDFVWCGHPHIPAASLETGTVVTLTAPSKTFNLAGLKAAFVVIPDPKLRRSFDRFVRSIHAGDLNSMGLLAAEAAYNGGGEWLDQVRAVIRENDALLIQNALLPEGKQNGLLIQQEKIRCALILSDNFQKYRPILHFIHPAVRIYVSGILDLHVRSSFLWFGQFTAADSRAFVSLVPVLELLHTEVTAMKMICFGDSNTYGYDPRSYFGGRYPAENRWVDILASETGWEVLNAGVNGREIPRGPDALRLLAEHAPVDLFLVMLGTNDLLQGASPSEAAARMEAFLKALLPHSESILLVAPPHMKRGAWVPDDELAAASIRLAEEYQTLAQKLKIPYADTRDWNVELTCDGVHFTEAGHHTFAGQLMRYLFHDKEPAHKKSEPTT